MASFVGACSPPAAKQEAAASGAEPCADDGARFPGAGICVGRASNYFDPAILDVAPPPIPATAKGCEWAFNETVMGDGSEAILYRALTCNGVATKLDYAGGAHSATLSYAASALSGDAAKAREVVQVFVSDPADPQAVIKYTLNELPKAEQAKCEVHPANIEGWPKDALVVGYNAAAATKLSDREPNAVCGKYGQNEDEMSFWLIRQGYAYFFLLGQDARDIDPGSFNLIKKNEGGGWGGVE
jgi:hypothetical protein